jgi:hypothetical protein
MEHDERTMDVNHPSWGKYLRRLRMLVRNEGCMCWRTREFAASRRILRLMKLSPEAVSASLDKFESDGCGCDCAVSIRY